MNQSRLPGIPAATQRYLLPSFPRTSPVIPANLSRHSRERGNPPRQTDTHHFCDATSVITRVLDTRAKTVRNVIYVPLYPIAEWLAENWWFLTSEFLNPAKEGDPDFHRRHSLGPSRDGYPFPNIKVISYGSRTDISWNSHQCQWARVAFQDDGGVRVDSNEFREVCASFIDTVIQRLDSLGVEDTFLHEEWDAIHSSDDEETAFCRAAAGLGWDPFALDDTERDRLILLADQLGGLLDEAIPALDTADPFAGQAAIESAIQEARLNGVALARIRALRSDVVQNAVTGPNPWNEGYDWARRLRRTLGLDGDPLASMADMADAIGEKEDLLNHATRATDVLTKTRLIDAVIVQGGAVPGFAFRRLNEDARRFHFCRAMAEVLASPDEDALVTRAQSERQRRSRAFAAEFLAPSSGLRKRVTHAVVDGDDIDELAVEYGVSPIVIGRQLTNHRIARVSVNG